MTNALTKSSRLAIKLFAWAGCGLLPPIAAQDPEPSPDVETIRKEMKRLWDGTAHLIVRGETINSEDGYRDEFELDYTNDGRRAVQMTRYVNGQPQHVVDRREDSWVRTSIIHMSDRPELIDRVVLYNQEQDAEHYVGPMFPLFWAILPDGRPLHTHLDEGATIEQLEPPNLYRIETSRPMMDLPITVTVDRERDWLPLKIVIGDDLSVIEVKEYDRAQGRWFPVAGTNVAKKVDEDGRTLDELERSEFTVDQFQFNTPINPDVYTLDLNTLNEGVLVSDKVRREERVIGGVEARIELHDQSLDTDDVAEKQKARPSEVFEMQAEAFQAEPASTGLSSSKVAWGLGLGGVVLLGIGAWTLRTRWAG